MSCFAFVLEEPLAQVEKRGFVRVEIAEKGEQRGRVKAVEGGGVVAKRDEGLGGAGEMKMVMRNIT